MRKLNSKRMLNRTGAGFHPKKLVERPQLINHTVSQSKNLNGNAYQTILGSSRTQHHFQMLVAPQLDAG